MNAISFEAGASPPETPSSSVFNSAAPHGRDQAERGPRERQTTSSLTQVGPWRIEVAGAERVHTRVLRQGERATLGSGGSDLCVADPGLRAGQIEFVVEPGGLAIRDVLQSGAIRIAAAQTSAALVVEERCRFLVGQTCVRVNLVGLGQGGSPAQQDVPGLVGQSAVMRKLAREVRRFAALSAPVLLQGETGTGKDVVARALHEVSGRKGPFIALNVGGLSESMADTELFGHRKGAFTGAAYSRPGVFEAANGGTLFLDEIADLHPSIQVKLLRVLEDQQVRPVGTHETTRVNTRVICASWAELQERVDEGRFRADLYHRVSTIRLELPPLASRKEDLPLLSEHLLNRHASELGMKELTSHALARLLAHDWRGNVRELGSVLYRAAALVQERSFIDASDIDSALPPAPRKRVPGFELCELERLLDANGGNVSAAARAARLPRSTFRTLLKRRAAAAKSGRERRESGFVVGAEAGASTAQGERGQPVSGVRAA
jgi:transcriptional regulator of acetoin/glycerol metabolism